MEVISENKKKQQLPNANTTLILGILSVILSCGIVGFVLGIIGLSLSKEGKEAYEADPDAWVGYSSLQAGRVLSIIGIVLGSFAVLSFLFWLVIGGAIFSIASGLAF